jgi:hypothetical protein
MLVFFTVAFFIFASLPPVEGLRYFVAKRLVRIIGKITLLYICFVDYACFHNVEPPQPIQVMPTLFLVVGLCLYHVAMENKLHIAKKKMMYPCIQA